MGSFLIEDTIHQIIQSIGPNEEIIQLIGHLNEEELDDLIEQAEQIDSELYLTEDEISEFMHQLREYENTLNYSQMNNDELDIFINVLME